MLKFGGSRPESDGTENAKDRERKQRHQRSAAAATGGATAVVPGNGTSAAMDTSRGGELTPKTGLGGGSGLQQMAPPDLPFGANTQPLEVDNSHCSKSSFFVQKFNFDFPRKLSIFFWVKNS